MEVGGQSGGMSGAVLGLVLLWALGGQALECYETKPGEPTATRLVDRPDAVFCVFVPGEKTKPGLGLWQRGSGGTALFPVGPEADATGTYSKIFDLAASPVYNIRSLCLFEEFDIGGGPEYMFRCLCRENACNKAASLPAFLDRQTSPSTVKTLF